MANKEHDKQKLQNMISGETAYVNWSEGGGGEVHRVDDTLLLYYVPCYGGEGELVLKAHISGHELVVDTVYSWT